MVSLKCLVHHWRLRFTTSQVAWVWTSSFLHLVASADSGLWGLIRTAFKVLVGKVVNLNCQCDGFRITVEAHVWCVCGTNSAKFEVKRKDASCTRSAPCRGLGSLMHLKRESETPVFISFFVLTACAMPMYCQWLCVPVAAASLP